MPTGRFCHPTSSGNPPIPIHHLLTDNASGGGESGSRVTRLIIASEHDAVRSALQAMLRARPDWQVVAEAADGKEAILKAFETTPDIAVIDDLLPLVGAVEVTRQNSRAHAEN